MAVHGRGHHQAAGGGWFSKNVKNTLYWTVVTVLVLITLLNPIRKFRAATSVAVVQTVAPPTVVVKTTLKATLPPPVEPELRDHIKPEELPDNEAPPRGGRDRGVAQAATKEVAPQVTLPRDAAAVSLQRSLLLYLEHRAATKPAKGSACFISLVRHTDEGLRRLARLLKNVKEQLPGMAARYPFVAFLEHGVDVQHVSATLETLSGFKVGTKIGGEYPLAHIYPAGVILSVLEESEFGRVPNYLKPEHLWAYRGHNYWGVSYRHMCRFFAVRVMFQPVLDKFNYYMRLDTDSFILAAPRSTTIAPVAHMEWDTSFRFNSLVVDELATHKPQSENDDAGIVTFNDRVHDWYRNSKTENLLRYLGFAEREEDVDLFHEMASRGSLYGFSMIHPQPSPEFLSGQFEAVDDFVRKEAADHHVAVGDPSIGIRRGGEQGPAPTPFNAPRGLGLHFWDNFEIVDLRLFRSKPKSFPVDPMTKRRPDEQGPAADDDGASPADSDFKRSHVKRAQIVNRFLTHMDRAGGIYYNRWGDAEIRTQTMSLVLKQEEYLYFNSLPYQHYHNFHCPQQRPKFAHAAVVPKWTASRPAGIISAEEKAEVITKLDSTYKEYLSGGSGVVAMHDAVESVLRVLSPNRATVEDDVRSDCTEQARRNYGQGSKGEGTAPMNPAETKANNQFFWLQDWPSM